MPVNSDRFRGIFTSESPPTTWTDPAMLVNEGCLVQVGNGMELDTVGCQFEPYWWRHCGVTWDIVPERIRSSVVNGGRRPE